jgi:hypothetical protein
VYGFGGRFEVGEGSAQVYLVHVCVRIVGQMIDGALDVVEVGITALHIIAGTDDRTERDRERMTARGAKQRAIDNESDEDATSAADVDEFDTQSVISEPVDVDVEFSDSAARRGLMALDLE